MRKLLVVYNTCGLSGREDPNQYVASISTLLAQKLDNVRIVMSDCVSSPDIRSAIQNVFKDKISYNFIDEVLPVNVTFNHSVLQGIKRLGQFDGYMYVDFGILFPFDRQLNLLHDLLTSGPYGIVSAQTNNDTGYHQTLGIGTHVDDHSENWKLFQNGHYVLKVGQAVNAHAHVVSNKIQNFYKRSHSDIFAAYCSESVLSFFCAAVNTKWVIHKDVMVEHVRVVHSNSAGFSPLQWQSQGNKPYEHPFMVDSVLDICNKGYQYGLGYEECGDILLHDPSKFNDEGYSLDSQLKHYIKNNLCLHPPLFDYNNIVSTWIS
jgi:hypothetical protein